MSNNEPTATESPNKRDSPTGNGSDKSEEAKKSDTSNLSLSRQQAPFSLEGPSSTVWNGHSLSSPYSGHRLRSNGNGAGRNGNGNGIPRLSELSGRSLGDLSTTTSSYTDAVKLLASQIESENRRIESYAELVKASNERAIRSEERADAIAVKKEELESKVSILREEMYRLREEIATLRSQLEREREEAEGNRRAQQPPSYEGGTQPTGVGPVDAPSQESNQIPGVPYEARVEEYQNVHAGTPSAYLCNCNACVISRFYGNRNPAVALRR